MQGLRAGPAGSAGTTASLPVSATAGLQEQPFVTFCAREMDEGLQQVGRALFLQGAVWVPAWCSTMLAGSASALLVKLQPLLRAFACRFVPRWAQQRPTPHGRLLPRRPPPRCSASWPTCAPAWMRGALWRWVQLHAVGLAVAE